MARFCDSMAKLRDSATRFCDFKTIKGDKNDKFNH